MKESNNVPLSPKDMEELRTAIKSLETARQWLIVLLAEFEKGTAKPKEDAANATR